MDILGNKVDSGTYVIYTIPQKEGDWTFILNRGINNWGVDGYKQSEDVFRAQVRTLYDMPKLETFTMEISDVKPESCQLRIMWDNYGLFVPIKTDVKEKVRAQIEARRKEGTAMTFLLFKPALSFTVLLVTMVLNVYMVTRLMVEKRVTSASNSSSMQVFAKEYGMVSYSVYDK